MRHEDHLSLAIASQCLRHCQFSRYAEPNWKEANYTPFALKPSMHQQPYLHEFVNREHPV
jgi:hypothetical protein